MGGGPALPRGLLSGVILALLALGLVGLLRDALIADDGPSLERLGLFFAEPGLARAAGLTLGTALGSTALAVAFAFVIFAGIVRRGAGRSMQRLMGPILAMPHAAFAFGLFLLLTPGGVLIRLVETMTGLFPSPPLASLVHDPAGLGLTVALALKETPFLVLIGLPALARQMPERGRDALVAGGVAPALAFAAADWPRLYAQLRLPILAVLAYGMSVVDMAQILGPTTPPPLAVLIVRLLSAGGAVGRESAAGGALALLGLTLFAILVWRLLDAAGGAAMRRSLRAGRRGLALQPVADALGHGAGALFAVAGAAVIVVLVVSAHALVWRYPDVLPSGLTLDAWRTLPIGREVVAATLLLALSTGLAATVLVVARLEGRLRRGEAPGGADAVLLAPLLAPQLPLVAGLSAGFVQVGAPPGFLAVALAHFLFVAPYVHLSLSDQYAALDPRLDRVGASLGMSPAARFWRLRLPMLLPSIAVATAVGLSVSFALYLPTLIPGAGRVSTVTTEAVALASGGDRRSIAALGLAQAALPALGFVLAAALPPVILRLMRRISP